jgi:hypothetical protein
LVSGTKKMEKMSAKTLIPVKTNATRDPSAASMYGLEYVTPKAAITSTKVAIAMATGNQHQVLDVVESNDVMADLLFLRRILEPISGPMIQHACEREKLSKKRNIIRLATTVLSSAVEGLVLGPRIPMMIRKIVAMTVP